MNFTLISKIHPKYMFVSGWLCPIIYLLTKGWRGQYWATGRESDKWTVGRSANILMANILISQQFGVRTHLTADVMDQADARVGMERCHLNTMGTGPAFWPLSYLPFLSRIHNKNWYCFFCHWRRNSRLCTKSTGPQWLSANK